MSKIKNSKMRVERGDQMALSVRQLTDVEIKNLTKKSAKGDTITTITTKKGYGANKNNVSYVKLMLSSHLTTQVFKQKPPNDCYSQFKKCDVVSGFKLIISKTLEASKNGSFKGLTPKEIKTLTNMLEIK